jgi:hypothetical protein
MLAGSMMFTQYEQQRVDHLITIATCVPIRAKLSTFLNEHLHGPEVPRQDLLLAKRETGEESFSLLLPFVLRLGLGKSGANGDFVREKTKLMRHITSLVEERLISALTEHVLFFQIANHRVRLGLPEQLPHDGIAPIVPTLPDVQAVMDLLGLPHEQTSITGPNWMHLPYRLEFISKYFAAYQRDPDPQIQQEPDAQQNPGALGAGPANRS